MVENGKLIVLEAVNDKALAPLAAELGRWLRENGLPVKETHEPTYGPAGTQILLARQGRLHFDAASLALLYLADRLDHVQRPDGIESSLRAGNHVICMHYGMAAVGRLWGQVEGDWLCQIDALCRVPDLTLYVDLPVEGRLQEQLREGYLAALRCLESNGQEITVVDGGDTPSRMGLACQRHMARLLRIDPPDCG